MTCVLAPGQDVAGANWLSRDNCPPTERAAGAHLRQRLGAHRAQAGRGRLAGRHDEEGLLAAGLSSVQCR